MERFASQWIISVCTSLIFIKAECKWVVGWFCFALLERINRSLNLGWHEKMKGCKGLRCHFQQSSARWKNIIHTECHIKAIVVSKGSHHYVLCLCIKLLDSNVLQLNYSNLLSSPLGNPIHVNQVCTASIFTRSFDKTHFIYSGVGMA